MKKKMAAALISIFIAASLAAWKFNSEHRSDKRIGSSN